MARCFFAVLDRLTAGQPLTLRLLARWPLRATLPAGLLLVGAGVALTGLCHQPWQFGLSVAVWSVGEITTAGSFQTIVTTLAPVHLRGRYAGALGIAWGAAGLIGPVLGSAAYAAAPALLWSGVLAAGVLAAAGQFRLLTVIDRRSAELS